jgi:hypothetical protein
LTDYHTNTEKTGNPAKKGGFTATNRKSLTLEVDLSPRDCKLIEHESESVAPDYTSTVTDWPF